MRRHFNSKLQLIAKVSTHFNLSFLFIFVWTLSIPNAIEGRSLIQKILYGNSHPIEYERNKLLPTFNSNAYDYDYGNQGSQEELLSHTESQVARTSLQNCMNQLSNVMKSSSKFQSKEEMKGLKKLLLKYLSEKEDNDSESESKEDDEQNEVDINSEETPVKESKKLKARKSRRGKTLTINWIRYIGQPASVASATTPTPQMTNQQCPMSTAEMQQMVFEALGPIFGAAAGLLDKVPPLPAPPEGGQGGNNKVMPMSMQGIPNQLMQTMKTMPYNLFANIKLPVTITMEGEAQNQDQQNTIPIPVYKSPSTAAPKLIKVLNKNPKLLNYMGSYYEELHRKGKPKRRVSTKAQKRNTLSLKKVPKKSVKVDSIFGTISKKVKTVSISTLKFLNYLKNRPSKQIKTDKNSRLEKRIWPRNDLPKIKFYQVNVKQNDSDSIEESSESDEE